MKKNIIFLFTLLFTATLFMSNSCEKENNSNSDNSSTQETIDGGLDILPTDDASVNVNKPASKEKISYQFTGNYDDLWLKVDSLQNLGLYRSALEVVNVIFDNARKENNAPQVVKSVIHQMKYNSFMTEDDFVVAIDGLNEISANSSFPLKQIIHSVTADVYWGFYQSNRWRFYNRTQTVNFKNDDIRTWDLNKITDHVIKHYNLSLSNPDSLQRASITDFKDMLVMYNETVHLRPTLFDFLAHRALSFFENSESAISLPAEKFQVSGRSYFGSSIEFIRTPVQSKDSMSNALYATRILIDLTRFHIDDKSPEALIDIELRRLKYARNHSTETEKDSYYIDALNRLAEQYEQNSSYTEIRYYCAEYYNNQSSKYDRKEEAHRWDRKKALGICEEAINRFPESHGGQMCNSLRKTILNKSLSFNTESSYAPNTTGKMLVNYQNIDTLYFRIVKVNWDFFHSNKLYGEELISKFLNQKIEKEWTKVFTDPGDYLSHSTEIAVEMKNFGQYVVLASPDKDFKLHDNAIAYGSYWVTNLSYNYRRNEDETYEVYVTDRESGEPIKSVKADIFIEKYNYVTRNYDIKKQESYTSDENGMFTIHQGGEYRYIYIDLIKGEDRYNNTSQIYQYKPYNKKKSYSTTQFYTDRTIYRPGQTIYFKGIRIHHDGENHTLETNKQSVVTLYDVNYQKVADLSLTTNDYGTFSGSFTVPTGVLNGQMHLADEFGTKYFSVEEYKRPKFEVTFEPIKGEYKIGQTIKMKGTAKAFAGSNIDGAQVQYRVTRSCSFPSWTWYRWGYYPFSQTTEIVNGTMTTDENGEFIIEFDAKEDLAIEKKYYPYYTYNVSADITDVNGETHGAQQWTIVGYNAMNLSVGVGGSIERSGKNRFKVSTTNLNGEKVEGKGIVTIHRLKEPDGIYRSSLWSKPDIQEFTKEQYRKLFPHDVYDKELDVSSYDKGEQVLNITFNTAESDSIDFTGMKNWKPGRYIIESNAVDSFGEPIKDIRYITILDKTDTKSPTTEIWSVTPIKSVCEPGENAEFLISTGDKNLKVLYELEHKGQIYSRKFITLFNSQQHIVIPIEEKHRGNITVHFTTVRYGRTYNSSQVIIVPFSNKELEIKFETFRDKLQPGQQEQWKLKISGPKGEKVAAEMLAAMYDASLDEFASNVWYLQVFNAYYSSKYWYSNSFSMAYSQLYYKDWNTYSSMPHRYYDQLNWWGYYYHGNNYYRNYNDYGYFDESLDYDGALGGVMMDRMEVSEEEIDAPMGDAENTKRSVHYNYASNSDSRSDKNEQKALEQTASFTTVASGYDGKDASRELSAVKARSNLNETAFFFPHLQTNEQGEVIINFTIPESLTKWKFLGLAHTKNLKSGTIQEEVITQKELMVMPNAPRFFREGDKMTFTAKVSNVSEEDLDGTAQLFLFDALTMKPIDAEFKNDIAQINFSTKKGQSTRLSWDIEVPFGIGAVTYRVVAKAKNHTDGEEMSIPVLSNRMLVTESMPLPIKGIGTKEFTFTKLVSSENSNTIQNHKLTLEFTSNPAWYAIQSMPYMMEYPYECSEQVFTRFYANSLASHIVNSNPKIKEVFEAWKDSSPEAFLSNLEKNEELKSLVLSETPWVLDAKDESERKKRVALLFELHKMERELKQALRKLDKMQVTNGGWAWFPGMEESRYITQHIITGMGHLDHLGVKDVRENGDVWRMVTKGVNYLDQRIIEDYEWLKRHDPNYLTEQRISQIQIQYLYARSYFKDIPINGKLKEAFDYYQKQASTYWKNFNVYNEGMIALQAKRYEIPKLPEQIMASLKERAILHEELGMYWKDNIWGYYWYEAPIETQALLIEAFDEVTGDMKSVEEMKVWLLKQKQTTDWKTTKATAEACYALLLRGTDILSNEEQVVIKVNNQVIDPEKLGTKVEAGTGYFKTSWTGDDIDPAMGHVSVTRSTEGVSWGAMYWQYFEDLDKITTHETPLKLIKQLFLVQTTESGIVMTPVTDTTSLKPGDKVRVRIELRSDRDMEYVHMKDMRAAGFEPVNVFSRYKWQDGLGYYESTGDAATNFFMDYMRKGTYVFEYDLRVSHFGDFSNGITTIQCMYAPEFTSHSEGIRVNIEEE